MRRFKVEFLSVPNAEPLWFDTREELDRSVAFMKSCPVDDGPLRLRITEYGVTKTEEV
jgi:hypothetical protein